MEQLELELVTPRKMDSRMRDVWEKILDIGLEYNCSLYANNLEQQKDMTKLRCQVAVQARSAFPSIHLPPLYWRPKYHLRFPPDFQRMVFTFMVCNRRECKPYLPMEVIWCVLEMLDYTMLGHDWAMPVGMLTPQLVKLAHLMQRSIV
jgi:hypothetical protein